MNFGTPCASNPTTPYFVKSSRNIANIVCRPTADHGAALLHIQKERDQSTYLERDAAQYIIIVTVSNDAFQLTISTIQVPARAAVASAKLTGKLNDSLVWKKLHGDSQKLLRPQV